MRFWPTCFAVEREEPGVCSFYLLLNAEGGFPNVAPPAAAAAAAAGTGAKFLDSLPVLLDLNF